jgi:leucyl/phenylalanyl-tRNA--protein transferase
MVVQSRLVTAWHTRPQPVPPSRWAFRAPERWPANDLVAAGGDLEPPTLIAAYRMGLFPMQLDGEHGEESLLGWWSPDPRGVLPLDNLRITRSLRKSLKHSTVRVDTCFTEVMRACGNPHRPHGWITPAFISAYSRLHDLGYAHSVEVFDGDGQLAGGLYGVKIGGLFAGESMFSARRDASKVALVALVDLMRASRMPLLDVQWWTPHLGSLGVIEIPRAEYLRQLAEARDLSLD